MSAYDDRDINRPTFWLWAVPYAVLRGACHFLARGRAPKVPADPPITTGETMSERVVDLGGNTYRLPNGLTVARTSPMPDQERRLLEARHQVAMEYVRHWGAESTNDLTIPQIVRIGEDPRWKTGDLSAPSTLPNVDPVL